MSKTHGGAVTAIQKLAPSRLAPVNTPGLADDVDLAHFNIAMRGKASIDIRDRIESGKITRTIQGASTVEITVRDQDRVLLNSGKLQQGVDTKIDGLWFRLTKFEKSGDSITLTFVSREAALLMNHVGKHVFAKNKFKRAQFVQYLVREVKEIKIPFVSPDLKKIKAIKGKRDKPTDNEAGNAPGFAFGDNPHVKGRSATPLQKDVLGRVLAVGISMNVRRKLLVVANMVITQESACGADVHGDGVHNGVFQQDTNPGSAWRNRGGGTAKPGKLGDVEADAHAFFNAATVADAANPFADYAALAEDIQVSGQGTLYAQWRAESERNVKMYGVAGTDSATPAAQAAANQSGWSPSGSGQFDSTTQWIQGKQITRAGKQKLVPESAWACADRMAQEIQVLFYESAGTVYFISYHDLFMAKPKMDLSEETGGVDWIDGSVDIGRPKSTISIKCRAKKWAADPGEVIIVRNLGPMSGKWIVQDIDRDIFTPDCTITAMKPLARLPEPQPLTNYSNPATSGTDPVTGGYGAGVGLVYPIPEPYPKKSGGLHQTAGLAGYPAIDFFGKPGTPVVAVESGVIDRFSGHDPILGPPDGVGGPLGWSIYLTGDSGTRYFYTHLNKRYVSVGQRVSAGTLIANIADYDKYAGPGFSHTHVGAHTNYSAGKGGNTIEDVAAAPQAVKI